MPKDPHRRRRIESELIRVVSELLRREVRDPRIGSVTITAATIAPDLGHARLFYTIFGLQAGDKRDPAGVQAGLNGAARFMRGQVARQLKLRVAPELHFEPDLQLMEGMRLNELIDRAVADDEQRHTDDGQTNGGD